MHISFKGVFWDHNINGLSLVQTINISSVGVWLLALLPTDCLHCIYLQTAHLIVAVQDIPVLPNSLDPLMAYPIALIYGPSNLGLQLGLAINIAIREKLFK